MAHEGFPHTDPQPARRTFKPHMVLLPWGILKRIIASDKTLEVNTNHGLNPNAEILARYFELGGRNVSFGSDAHHGGLCDGWDEAVKVLKDIGFSELSVFKRRKRESVPL